MKVYVFGGSKDDCIELANQLNGSGATALIGKDNEAIKDVSGRMGKGIDCAIMISDDPTKASLQASKDSRMRAAVCYNQKALDSASGENANLFIVDPDSLDKLDFSTLSGGSQSTTKQRSLSGQPQRQQVRDREEKEQPPMGSFSSFNMRSITSAIPFPKLQAPTKERPSPKKEQRKPQAVQDDDDDYVPKSKKSSSSGGLGGTIKDIFGIED